MIEQFDRQIPEYYPIMYLDGYTPEQILHAAHRKVYQDYMERKEAAQIPTLNIKSVVKIIK